MTNCCVNCFRDHILRDAVINLNVKGDCAFCGSSGVFVYDFAKNVDIQNRLLILIGRYELYDSSDKEASHTFAHELTDKWRLFELPVAATSELLHVMYRESPDGTFDGYAMEILLDGNVHLTESETGVDVEHNWYKFTKHLKYTNRFFISFIDLDALGTLISYTRTTCESGTVLTRARIAEDGKGFAPGKEMGAPPLGLAGNGRINPVGISELYMTLGNDDEADDTALHEIRAGMHDYVTFGKFVLDRTITIADLSRIADISPFDVDESDLNILASNLDILDGMSREISKPMRRGDDSLEYIPSQYIAEFIKSLGYDGVKYSSTLKSGGMNLCLFDPMICECRRTYTKRVNEVMYSTVS